MRSTAPSESDGNSSLTRGAMIREERSYDFVSPEAEKMSAIQSRTGTQYLSSSRIKGTR